MCDTCPRHQQPERYAAAEVAMKGALAEYVKTRFPFFHKLDANQTVQGAPRWQATVVTLEGRDAADDLVYRFDGTVYLYGNTTPARFLLAIQQHASQPQRSEWALPVWISLVAWGVGLFILLYLFGPAVAGAMR